MIFKFSDELQATFLFMFYLLDIDETLAKDILLREGHSTALIEGFVQWYAPGFNRAGDSVKEGIGHFQNQTMKVYSSVHFPTPAEMKHWFYPNHWVGSNILKIH